jgi:glutathione S-transferase
MPLKIHAFPFSPRAFKVLVVANHLGVDYEFCFCDLRTGMQRTPEFTTLNPNQKMPALEDGDFKLWESNAIIHYLASRQSDSGMIGADVQARADVLRWLFWESTTWDPACATLIFERVVKPVFTGGEPDPSEVERGLRMFNAAARLLDAHLKGRAFIRGSQLTLADYCVASALTLTAQAGLPAGDYPELMRWFKALEELPAWRRTLEMQALPAAA